MVFIFDKDNIAQNKNIIFGISIRIMSKTRKANRKTKRKWSLKYKKSINCKRPKGFSQKQHCKYGRKK